MKTIIVNKTRIKSTDFLLEMSPHVTEENGFVYNAYTITQPIKTLRKSNKRFKKLFKKDMDYYIDIFFEGIENEEPFNNFIDKITIDMRARVKQDTHKVLEGLQLIFEMVIALAIHKEVHDSHLCYVILEEGDNFET